MGFKGIYKDKSSISKVGILFILMVISGILHVLAAIALISLFSNSGMAFFQSQDLTNQISVNYLKLMQFFSGIGIFITPTLLYAFLIDFDFKFNSISRQNIILGIAIIMLITPFIGLLLEWNMTIPLPECISNLHVDNNAIIVAFLKMETIWDLLYTLIVIAVVPAIGEELFFRGYLQKELADWIKNPKISILITALLFSAIHLDFHAFIPRFVLGILLGYLYYWSQSLLLPILAHFVNNAQAVIFSFYLFKLESGSYSFFSEIKISPTLAIFSFFSVVLLLYILHQNIKREKVD